MILATMLLAGDTLVLGSDMYPEGNFQDLCQEQFNIHKDGNPLQLEAFETYDDMEEPTNIYLVLVAFLLIHLVDVVLFHLTKESWELWKVIEPDSRKKLWNEDKSNATKAEIEENPDKAEAMKSNHYIKAWMFYFALHVIRIVIMTILFFPVMPQKVCQPFIAVTIYQDYFFTIALSFWIIIEEQMGNEGKKKLRDEIVHSSTQVAKKHFYRINRIIMKGEKAPISFDFRKEDDENSISDKALI